MSAVEAFGDPDGSPRQRLFTRLAHAAYPAAFVYAAFLVASAVWPDWFPVGVTAVAVLAVVVLYISASTHIELARICLRCWEEVPADASAQAARKRWVLKIRHTAWDLLAWLALTVAAVVINKWVFADGEDSRRWLNLPSNLFPVLWLYAMFTHHRLRPWCPFCKRWDDGGEHELTPTPDPSGTKVGQ